MATSGYFENAFQTGYRLRVEWIVFSQSVANNTSELVVTAYLVSDGSSYTINSSNSKSMVMSIDGVNYEATISNAKLSGGETRQIMSRTVTITHNSDGTRSVSLNFSLKLSATLSGTSFSWVYAPATGFATATLNTIPRTSAVSLSASTVELGKTLTINTNRASSSFTHKLYYGWYGEDYVLLASGVGASYNWTVPLTFANNIPDATQGWGTIRCETYNGSSLIGTSSATFTGTVPASMVPTCSIQVLDATDTKDTYGSLVKGLSKLYVKTTARTSYNSPIVSYTVTANHTHYSQAEITTDVLRYAGDTTVQAYVTDKRGRVSAAAEATFPVLDYGPPQITSLYVRRTDWDGNDDEQGDFISVTFGASVYTLNNKNTAAYVLRYKKSTETEWASLNLSDLANNYTVTDDTRMFIADGDASYNVEIVVTDKHYTSTRSNSASTTFTLLNWSADGTGMAVGKISEEPDTFEVAMASHFYDAVQTEGNRYAFSSPGTAGSAGWVLMAQVKVMAANADTPITFVFSRRGALSTMTVHLRLSNPTATTSSLASIRYEGTNYGCVAFAQDSLTWNVYVEKGSAYDTITLQDWYTSKTMQSRVSVTFPGDLVKTVAEPYYRATPAPLDGLIDLIFPVGYVLILYSLADPNNVYPGTTWERIENAFLWAMEAGSSIGQMGGEKTHTLTKNEMPQHSHDLRVAHTSSGNVVASNIVRYNSNSTSYVGSVTTEVEGWGLPHNNMPPYIQVAVWRRTS